MTKPLFSERLTPSKGTVAALLLSSPMVLLGALPFSQNLGIALAIAVPATLISIAYATTPKIILVEDSLQVGRMKLPITALGKAEHHTQDAARFEKGPGLSPGSQRLFRGDIEPVVKIFVVDPSDPTEYLLFSSRRGAELVSALDANRTKFGL